MSIACLGERRSQEPSNLGEAIPLGRLLKPVRRELAFDENGFPILVDNILATEWGCHVERVLRSRFERAQLLVDRTQAGRQIRKAVLKVLQRLETGSSAAGLTRKQVSTLRQLVLLCARDQDWASPAGPIVGASNAVISRRLGSLDPAEALKPLLKMGLIAHHKRRGNGHRYFRVVNKGTDAERVEASGISLGPVIVLLDALQVLASYEEDLVEQHITLPRRVAAILSEAKSLLTPHLNDPWAIETEQLIKEACTRAHNAKKAGIERKRKELQLATHLLELVKDRLSLEEKSVPGGEIAGPVGGGNHPHIYGERKNLDEACRGFPGDNGTDLIADSATSAGTDDLYGIERVGFDWSEAPHLFPFFNGLVRVDARQLRTAIYDLGRVIGIHDQKLTRRAIETLGHEAATLAMLITGQRSADDEIRKSPEIYFRGLLKRGRRGDLNLGHAIFGRRQLTNASSSRYTGPTTHGYKQRSATRTVNLVRHQSW